MLLHAFLTKGGPRPLPLLRQEVAFSPQGGALWFLNFFLWPACFARNTFCNRSHIQSNLYLPLIHLPGPSIYQAYFLSPK